MTLSLALGVTFGCDIQAQRDGPCQHGACDEASPAAAAPDAESQEESDNPLEVTGKPAEDDAPDAAADASRVSETEGGTAEAGAATTATSDGGLSCYPFRMHAPGTPDEKFQVGVTEGEGVRTGHWPRRHRTTVDSPWQGTVYGVVVRPMLDHAPIVRGMELYRVESGPTGVERPSMGNREDRELIYHWGPGAEAVDLRDFGSVSLELPASTYSLIVTYDSTDPTAEDGSGLEVCVQTEATAQLASLSRLGKDFGDWVRPIGIDRVIGTFCDAESDVWTDTCDPKAAEPIHLMLMTPSMSELGAVRFHSTIEGGDRPRTLLDQSFSFDAHTAYALDAVLAPGERIKTTCTFESPTCAIKAPAAGGGLCHAFVYAWPKGALAREDDPGSAAYGKNTCVGRE